MECGVGAQARGHAQATQPSGKSSRVDFMWYMCLVWAKKPRN